MSASTAAATEHERPDGPQPASPPIRRGKRFWRQGEPFVWAAGAALSAVLLMIAILLGVIAANALGFFWPKPVALVTLDDGTALLGQRLKQAVNTDNGETSVQFKTANRELTGMQDFHWYPQTKIASLEYPKDVFVLERTGNGDFYGLLEDVQTPTIAPPSGGTPAARFHEALEAVRAKRAAEIAPLEARIAEFTQRLHALEDQARKLIYRKGQALKTGAAEDSPEVKALDAQLAVLRGETQRTSAESDEVNRDKLAREAELRKNVARFRVGSGEVHSVAFEDIVRPYAPNAMGFFAKVGHYCSKLWELVADKPRESNTEGGVFPSIFGTVMLVFLMSVSCFPLGVLAGVYLGEYAREGTLVRLVRIAVNNLAGIPSIVYGIFGLGFFVYGIGGTLDRWFFPESVGVSPVFGTGGILWASLTLGLLTVPVVIVSTEEALRTIPRGIREGSYALGATKFQTLCRVLLPMSSPGVMTGFILAMARAAGEVAPLMLTGAIKLAPSLPVDGDAPYFHVERKFMHLGFHIFDVAFQSPNVEATQPMVYMTALLLVLLVLAMSSIAIYTRNRMRKRYQSRSI
jgi:phosphate transport system permease protein